MKARFMFKNEKYYNGQAIPLVKFIKDQEKLTGEILREFPGMSDQDIFHHHLAEIVNSDNIILSVEG